MKHCNKKIVGMDVHKKTIVNAVLPKDGAQITERNMIENNPQAIEKMVNRLAKDGEVEFVYEAGPCGYEIQRQITKMGHKCVVIAPSLMPRRPGDRVKTDRRDAEKLARFCRAGELTEIHIPTREEEADRDLVRAREDALSDRLRSRHRLLKFLLRQGRVYRESGFWTKAHQAWLKGQKFEWSGLQQTFEANVRAVDENEARLKTLDQLVQDLAQKDSYKIPVQYFMCLKGVGTLSALTLIVETQDFKRFPTAGGYMSYVGLVVSENSSGERVRRGSITKAGNHHIRRVLGESAWSYRYGNTVSRELSKRRNECPTEIVQIAKKAQDRLHRKYRRMTDKSKPPQVVVTSVARELAGFIWSLGQHFPLKTAA